MFSRPLSRRTPLHAAAFSDHVECVQLLLSHDAPVDVADESGSTPLMMAAAKGRSGVIGMKMPHGFTALSLCGSCLFLMALLLRFHGSCLRAGVPELLLASAGASASLVDKNGNTALHLACSNVSATPSDEPLCFTHALRSTSKLSEVNLFFEGGCSYNQRGSILAQFNLGKSELNHFYISKRQLMREEGGRAECHLGSSRAGWDVAEDVTEGGEVNDEVQRLQGHVLVPVATGTRFMFKNCTAVNLQSYIMFGARQNLSELKSIT